MPAVGWRYMCIDRIYEWHRRITAPAPVVPAGGICQRPYKRGKAGA